MDRLAALMRKMDYEFVDQSLLVQALTHRSKGSENYERLEFLGDSILGFVIAEWLYQSYPKLAEGRLSRMRSSLVRKESLAKVARQMELSDYLILGEGELKSGGFNRDSILSDTVESLIGAIYLDSDLKYARAFILAKYEPLFDTLSQRSSFKDAKSSLQENMQKRGLQLPQYDIIKITGEAHKQEFTISCELPGLEMSEKASASSRRLAEQKVAKLLLEQITAQ